jgi:catechol 2,3-dioxygenase-like lactoylglutathione lyase family enzyme
MTVEFNHTIIWCRDQHLSSSFLAEILDLPAPRQMTPFSVLDLGNRVSLDFLATENPIVQQHYAFLVSEQEFDSVLDRIRRKRLSYWADPMRTIEGAVNHNDGGRGFYFADPNNHSIEVITRPYGAPRLG